jgi:hypothetical protein
MCDEKIELLLKEIDELKSINKILINERDKLKEQVDDLETNVQCPQICQFCHCPFNFNQVKPYCLDNAFFSDGVHNKTAHFYDFCDKCIEKLIETKKIEHEEGNHYILKKSFSCFINHLNKHKRLFCIKNDV